MGNINISNTDVLKNKCLMVRLSRKKINRNKMDKDLGQELRDKKNVTDSAAVRVNKSIFTAESSEKYMKVFNEGSKYFYRVTLPWDDQGWRLLSIDLFKEFTTKFKGFTRDYREAVLDWVENIGQHIEDSKAVLQGAWSQDDYKFISANGLFDREWLLDQFGFEVEFNTVTNGDDLRASLTETDREVIAEQINAQAMAKFAKAQEHIITSLHECIFSIHERLCVGDQVFRDTLLSNLEDLVDLIPKLNIANDPALNLLASEAKVKLLKWDPQTLRDDPMARKEVSDDAAKILNNMKGII